MGLYFVFVVMQQTNFFFNSCRNKLRDKLQEKMPSVPQPITRIKREFPPLFWGIFFNDKTDNSAEGKFTSTSQNKKKGAIKPFGTGNSYKKRLSHNATGPCFSLYIWETTTTLEANNRAPTIDCNFVPSFKDPIVRILP